MDTLGALVIEARAQGQPGPATCHAPFSSLYLDQRGFARVCPANAGVPLGNVARSSLREIWQGPVAMALRDAFRSGTWGDGCDLCSWQASATSDDQAYARLYDEFGSSTDHPEWPVHLELALSNRCNLQCVMCAGDQSSAIRRHREGFPALPAAYPDRFFDELVELLPHLQRAKFLGGEPFLVREHHRVWDLMVDHGIEVPIHVTTNGTVWNERVERVLEHLPTSLAISFDGLRPATIEAIRVGADAEAMFTNLDRFQAYVERRETYLSLTFCLMTENWREFGEFLAYATARDLDVFVNTVTNPTRLSLYSLPPAQLTEVVEHLEGEAGALRPRLGRNASTWEDQLRRLRARLDGAGEAARPRWLHTSDEQVELVSQQVAVSRRGPVPRREDHEELATWAHGGPVSTLALDDEDRVARVEPADRFLDLPLSVAGHPFDEVAILLSSFYGRRTTTQVLESTSRVLDRVARYESVEGHHDVRSRLRRFPDGSMRVTVAARSEALTS